MHTIRIAVTLLVAAAEGLSAQQDPIGRSTPMPGPPVARSAVIATPPRIDGRLDDEAWQGARPLEGFTQREPRIGDAVSERTVVRIMTDREALYIGAWLYDRTPNAIVPGEKIRDAILTNSDYFGIILDTYHDRQNGFIFATTPSGIEYDGQVTKEGEGGGVTQTGQSRTQSGSMGGFNLNWDATWTVATSADSAGWYAEMRIPFSTLRYGGGGNQVWGLNLVRGIRRWNEEAFWAPIPRQFGLMRLSLAGRLEGIDVPSRRVATVTPYGLAAAKKEWTPELNTDYPLEVGGDAKFGLTPSLTLDLTYNTDFAQVEVDEVRSNLTRFPLFFPEKRPFFLEGAGIFSAGTPQAVDLFFSRRIGLNDSGQTVPIIGGGRLTGKVAGLTVGVLQLFTDDVEPVSPGNSYTVARVTRELGARSRIGGIFVQRIATSDGEDHNRTYGLDGRVAFSDAVTLDWWGAKTETPGLDGRDAAYTLRLGQQDAKWNNFLRYLQVGEDFNPEVGFLPRAGYRYFEGSLFRMIRTPGIPWMRQFNPHITLREWRGMEWEHQSSYYHFDPEFDFSTGGRLGPELNFQSETLTEPFEIADGVVLAPRRYNWVFNAWDFDTDPSARFSLISHYELGGFYDGTKFGGVATLTFRPSAAFSGSLLVDYQDVNLDEGDFTRSVIGLKLGYFFTPRISIQSLVQYGNQAHAWTANARFAWLNTAGTGLFVVFNDAEEAEGIANWTRPQARSLTIKYTRQLGTN